MVTEDQSEVVQFLSSPRAFVGRGQAASTDTVERIETHSAFVFLTGTRAWKLKRAVRFDYLDFSTADRRRTMCDAEFALNRRTAPGLYRGVVPVTREANGSLAVNGSGVPVDWLVEMSRFDQDALLDRLSSQQGFIDELADGLAAAVAKFHAGAPPRRDHGGAAAMRWVVDGNGAGLAEFGRSFLELAACYGVIDRGLQELARRAPSLDQRRDDGFVRQCHGDLHLRNIVLIEGTPTLFDAIEFNDELACIDVFYDLAFLIMDLWRRQLRRQANRVFNRYLAETHDLEGVPLMPLFLSCRAAIRAKTQATAASLQRDPALAASSRRASAEYLALAGALIGPHHGRLVAIGGLSGSGKSTLARAIASELGAVPGAVILRSDEIRKELSGVQPLQRLGPDAYSAGMSSRVYEAIADRAGAILKGGHSVIVDAVLGRPADRRAIEEVARTAGVRFSGLWLDAPTPVLLDRVARRGPDPSDADAAVVAAQISTDIGSVQWHRLEAVGAADALRQRALAALGVDSLQLAGASSP